MAGDVTPQQFAEALAWWAIIDSALKRSPAWYYGDPRSQSAPVGSSANITHRSGSFLVEPDAEGATMVARSTIGGRR